MTEFAVAPQKTEPVELGSIDGNDIRFSGRPGYGDAGRPTHVVTNLFDVKFRVKGTIFQYDISVANAQESLSAQSKGKNRALFKSLIEQLTGN